MKEEIIMEETNCPMCGQHCPVDELQCGRGRNHFQQGGEGHRHDERPRMAREEQDISAMAPDEALMLLLRRSGHYLHHNVGHGQADTQQLFGALSPEEQRQLAALLDKCTRAWH